MTAGGRQLLSGISDADDDHQVGVICMALYLRQRFITIRTRKPMGSLDKVIRDVAYWAIGDI